MAVAEDLISRPYQEQLEEISSRKNTIIHLPTGSGKTFIAVCLIRRFRQALEAPWGAGGKRTFFLVNTVPLVNQQKKVIETLCPVNGVGAYSGETGVDHWDKNKWDKEMQNNQVIVMTCQILSDMLTHAYIKIEDINLLIFDECHHAVDDHPMRLVMKHFESCPAHKHPRVLGLTATLLNANTTIGQVESSLRGLEQTFHATIATVNELGDVLNYSTNPNEKVMWYRKPIPKPGVCDAVKILEDLIEIVLEYDFPAPTRNKELALVKGQNDISSDPRKIPKAVKNMIITMIMLIEEMGAFGGNIGIIGHVYIFDRLKRAASTELESTLYSITTNYCQRAQQCLISSMDNEQGYDQIVKNSSQKILQMLEILKEYNPSIMDDPTVKMSVNIARKPLSAIIFTQQRFTAKVLHNLLNEVKDANPKEFGFLKQDFVVGFNVNPFNRTREHHYVAKTSHKALLMFGSNDLNCMISTSVIEEGVDIPQCLLVLRYDAPLEYRSYIQSKGRARSEESSFVVMVDEENRAKFLKKYSGFQQLEQHIQKMLVGSTDTRNAPTKKDIQELYDEDEIPAYVTPNGGRLPSVSAISLLNRYFSALPHDQFTQVTPAWIHEKVKVKVQSSVIEKDLITIILPLSCPIKEAIKGTPQNALKLAKRSAALNACIRLHQVGELDPDTLLPKNYCIVDFEDDEVKKCFLNWPWDEQQNKEDKDAPKPGSKGCVRKHRIAFSQFLNATPESSRYYLHIIKLTAAFPEPTESREKALYDFIKADEGFGFLTQQPLPKLCAFPTFMTIGEVTTELKMNYAVIELNEAMVHLVKRFHFFIFDQVLAIAKKFVIFEGGVNCLYAVPVKGEQGYDIDWDVIQKHTEVPHVEIPEISERRAIRVTEESYKHAVVSPWYRGTIMPDRYIVSKVLGHMTTSSFLNEESDLTYADYFLSKYNLEIYGDPNQPMLEVRNISSKMNCLLPRASTIRSLSDKQQKLISLSLGDDRPKGAHSENFVAELCIKFEFPGVLWYKAMMLPSIIHRLHMLLVAQELLIEVAHETGYGTPIISKNEEWLPIAPHMAIATSALLSQIEEKRPVNPVDRINRPEHPTGNEPPPKLYSMKDTLYQLQKKKLEVEYPWDEKIEPMDIERNLISATLFDVECYNRFITAPLIDIRQGCSNTRSPNREIRINAAIKPPPAKYIADIKLLSMKAVGRGPELRDVVSALTTQKSNDIFCLERAETLGDSFLKYAATLYLFHKFGARNEGQLTNIKSRLISNRNLYYAGERINLGGRMKVEQISPRKDFLVPGFFAPKVLEEFIQENKIRPTFMIGTCFSTNEALSGELDRDSLEALKLRFVEDVATAEVEPDYQAQNAMQSYLHTQAVSDKSVADCVEALIGTYLLSGGIEAAVKFVEWMRIFPKEDKLGELLVKSVPTAISLGKANERNIDFIMYGCRSAIEGILNYKFKDPSFLLEAISHASYIRNRLTQSYERLEFLGDAILDFLITSHIFENNPALKPGELTDLRSALVNNVTFAAYVVKLGLHKFICKELNPSLDNAIMLFVEHQVQRKHEIVEDVLYLIDEEESPMAEYVEVPKTLSDLFESLAGAIYLDSGGNLATVWSVIYPIMCNEIYEFSMRIPRQPVSVLHEMIAACPIFGDSKLVNPDLPGISKVSVPVEFTKQDQLCKVYGVGRNKSQAKRAAAKVALKILKL